VSHICSPSTASLVIMPRSLRPISSQLPSSTNPKTTAIGKPKMRKSTQPNPIAHKHHLTHLLATNHLPIFFWSDIGKHEKTS
jgi:hypothetical protein